MAEPLKNLYNLELISSLCDSIKSVYPKFKIEQFTNDIFDQEWEQKELKSRMKHISVILRKYLPNSYKESIKILKIVSSNFNGFQYMFFPGFVELYGLDYYAESIDALEYFTKYSSSEFAVRVFIKKYPKKMMSQMEFWTKSKSHHVRRLASEGCRPSLPWAEAFSKFKKDPKPILTVLTNLKNDESAFVRKSVANNLNDISKDNPQIVIDLAKKWFGKKNNTDKIIKHACRTLLKQGNTEVLNMFGYNKPDHIKISKFEIQKQVDIGGNLEFSLTISTEKINLGKLRIEYAIGFMKNNGKLSRKIFKISETDCLIKEKKIVKKHSFKIITTRKYYIGNHDIAIIVNGRELAKAIFILK